MPSAINSVQGDGVWDYLPAASPLIIAFYLADAGGDIKSEKYVNPSEAQMLLERRGVTSSAKRPKARGNQRRAKTEKVLMIFFFFWVKTILRPCLLRWASSEGERSRHRAWSDRLRPLLCDGLSAGVDLWDTMRLTNVFLLLLVNVLLQCFDWARSYKT